MSEKLCLQWNDFKENANGAFGNLREDTEFSDVTLVCEDGKQVQAHKIILAASSPFFQNILKRNTNPHLLIYMREIKSEDLLATIDFLYCGEANVYEDNLDPFLALSKELELKGFMGKADGNELTQTENVKVPAPKTENQPQNGEANISRSYGPFQTNEIGEVDMTLALTSCSSGNLQELDEKLDSMMEKTSKRQKGQPLYRCKVCGKEAKNGDLKKHIEPNHLEGVSIPCSSCEKTFRSRSSLAMHNYRNHQIL